MTTRQHAAPLDGIQTVQAVEVWVADWIVLDERLVEVTAIETGSLFVTLHAGGRENVLDHSFLLGVLREEVAVMPPARRP